MNDRDGANRSSSSMGPVVPGHLGPGELAAIALQRVSAFDGMVVDAETWADAHDYHRQSQRLHARALHGWGIVSGLSVTPADASGRAVVVGPGLALDRNGNVVCLSQAERVMLPDEPGTFVCTVRFAERPAAAANGANPSRIDETYSVRFTAGPLHPAEIEVARMVLARGTVVRSASDQWQPAGGEIDLRFRRQLQVPTGESLSIGQLVLANCRDQHAHRKGLINLVREIRATAPFAVQFLGDLASDDLISECNLLYVSGAGAVSFTREESERLQTFVAKGGLVFAEACAAKEAESQESGRFSGTLRSHLSDLHMQIQELGGEHPIFTARHVFAAPPPGLAGHAPLLGGGDVYISTNDYGCCWQGGVGGAPQSREVIRAAIEFGANIGWHAVRRWPQSPVSPESRRDAVAGGV